MVLMGLNGTLTVGLNDFFKNNFEKIYS